MQYGVDYFSTIIIMFNWHVGVVLKGLFSHVFSVDFLGCKVINFLNIAFFSTKLL